MHPAIAATTPRRPRHRSLHRPTLPSAFVAVPPCEWGLLESELQRMRGLGLSSSQLLQLCDCLIEVAQQTFAPRIWWWLHQARKYRPRDADIALGFSFNRRT